MTDKNSQLIGGIRRSTLVSSLTNSFQSVLTTWDWFDEKSKTCYVCQNCGRLVYQNHNFFKSIHEWQIEPPNRSPVFSPNPNPNSPNQNVRVRYMPTLNALLLSSNLVEIIFTDQSDLFRCESNRNHLMKWMHSSTLCLWSVELTQWSRNTKSSRFSSKVMFERATLDEVCFENTIPVHMAFW